MERRASFFPETQNVLNEITRQFDFIWPSLAGIDYLQKTLNTYMLENPSATEEDCTQHFVSESAFSRISFTKIFPNKSLDDFKREQAKALLFSLFALYEGWLLSLQNLGVITSNQNKKLQFFDPAAGGHRILNNLSVNESQMLKNAFYTHLTRSGSKYSYHAFNKQLLCYRVFKEIRNAIIHNGSMCSPALNSVIQLYLQNVISPSDINVTQLPNIVTLSIGDYIDLDLFDVVCFSDIVIKMISTIDAELSKSITVEPYFIKQLKHGRSNKYPIFDTLNRNKNLQKTKSYLYFLGFPTIGNWEKIHDRITYPSGRFISQKDL